MTLLEDFLHRNGQIAQHKKGEEATTAESTAGSTTLLDDPDQEEQPSTHNQKHSPLKQQFIVNTDENGLSIRSKIKNALFGIHNLPHYSLWALTHLATIALLLWFSYTLVVALGSILRFIQQEDSMSWVLFWGTIVYLIVGEIGLDED